jgi:MFS family permease
MRLRFFYGWVIIAVTFVTMGIGVNARTSFSLLFPPIIDEFHWERGVTAGAFSFGFLVSGIMSPLMGRMMDRFGPRSVMELGVVLMAGGLLLAPLTTQPWHLHLTIGDSRLRRFKSSSVSVTQSASREIGTQTSVATTPAPGRKAFTDQ